MALSSLLHALAGSALLLASGVNGQTSTPTQTWTPAPVCTNGLATPASSPGGTYNDVWGANWNVQCAQDNTGFSYDAQGTNGLGPYACFQGCDNRVGCTAWSFIGSSTGPKTGSGRCYYKYAAGAYYSNATVYAAANVITSSPNQPCPGYNGTTYTNCDGSVYSVYCNYNYGGGVTSLNTVTAASMPGCMSICAQTAGCTFFVYTYGGGEPGVATCYLKGSAFAPLALNGVYNSPGFAVLGLVSSATTSTVCYPTATSTAQVVGSASSTSTAINAGSSNSAVSTSSSSAAVVVANPVTTTTTTTTTSTSSSTSSAASLACTGTLAPNFPASCSGANSGAGNLGTFTDQCGSNYTVYCGFDTQPGASSTLGAASIQACMQLCDNTPGCVAATFQPSTCYLKNSFTGLTAAAGGLAGLVRYAPNPAYPSPVPAAGFVNASTGCGAALPAGMTTMGRSVAFSMSTPDGYNRTYLVKVPQYYGATSASPLILGFPGNGADASSIEQQTGYSGSSLNPYAVVVYVTGVGLGFQSNPAYAPGKQYANVDDIGFIKLLIANITASFCIDTGHIFAIGHSNGGGFVGVMACDPVLSVTIAAFAGNSAALYTNIDSSTNPDPNTMEPLNTPVQALCSPGRNDVPFVEFHGTADTQIAYAGSINHAAKALPSLPHWATDWSIRQGYGSTNVTTYQAALAPTTNGGPANVTIYRFGSGERLGIITHYRLESWVHAYPNFANDNSAPIDASSTAMAFFYRWTQYNSTSPSASSSASVSSSTVTSTTASFATNGATSTTSTSSSALASSSSVISLTATSSAAPTPTYVCPADSGRIVTDQYANQFVMQCQADTTLGNYAVRTVTGSWNDCFAACQTQTDQTCTGFTYTGGANGVGSGSCFLKNAVANGGTQSFARPPNNPANYVAAIMSRYYNAAGDTLTATSSTTSSSRTLSVSTTSSVSVSATPTVSPNQFACPANNNQTVTDASGIVYQLSCGNDTTGGTYSQFSANTFDDCFGLCDNTPTSQGALTCTAFTYDGGVNGVGPGQCYLKNGAAISFSSTYRNTLVGAIRPAYMIAPVTNPTPIASCPSANGSIITDSSGVQYQIGCGFDTNNPNFQVSSARISWNDCFALCDNATTTDHAGQCTAFNYVGGANGVGEGTCFLKNYAGERFIIADNPPITVAAIRYPPGGTFPGAPISSSSSSISTAADGSTSTSVAPPAATTNVCVNQAVVSDGNGTSYQLSCSSDTSGSGGGAYLTGSFPGGDFAQCEPYCTANACGAWIWAPYPISGGACYLKHLPQTPIAGSDPGMVAGFIYPPGAPPTYSTTSSSSASSLTSSSASSSIASSTSSLSLSFSSSSLSLSAASSTPLSSSSSSSSSSLSMSSSLPTSSSASSSASLTLTQSSVLSITTSATLSPSMSSSTSQTSSAATALITPPGYSETTMSSMTSASSSSLSSSASATPSLAVCSNNTIETDASGASYTVYCGDNGYDTAGEGGGAFATQTFADGDYRQCETQCDAAMMCGAWTWSPGSTGGGDCFLKHPPQYVVRASSPGLIAGIAYSNTTSATSSTSSSMTASSSAAASSGAVCTNGTVVTDASGVSYNLYCSSDSVGSGGGAYATQEFSGGDFTQCETVCSADSTCGAWTWSPGSTGGGACFLKHLPQSPVSGFPGFVVGIVSTPSSSSSSSMSSATAESTPSLRTEGTVYLSTPVMASTSTESTPSLPTEGTVYLSTPIMASTSTDQSVTSSLSYSTDSMSTSTTSSASASTTSTSSASSSIAGPPSYAQTSSSVAASISSSASVPSPTSTSISASMSSMMVSASLSITSPVSDAGTSASSSVADEQSSSSISSLGVSSSAAALSTSTPPSTSMEESTSAQAPPQYSSVPDQTTTSSASSTSSLPGCGSAAATATAGANTACADPYGNTFNVTQGTRYIGQVSVRAVRPNLNSCLTTCGHVEVVTGPDAAGLQAAQRPPDATTVYTAPPMTTTTTTASSSLSTDGGINTGGPGPVNSASLSGIAPAPYSSSNLASSTSEATPMPATSNVLTSNGATPPPYSSPTSLSSLTSSTSGQSGIPEYSSSASSSGGTEMSSSSLASASTSGATPVPASQSSSSAVSVIGYSSVPVPSTVSSQTTSTRLVSTDSVTNSGSSSSSTATVASNGGGLTVTVSPIPASSSGSMSNGNSIITTQPSIQSQTTSANPTSTTLPPSAGPPCPLYNNATYTDSQSAPYTVYCNSTYSGTVLSRTPASQLRRAKFPYATAADDCLAYCDSNTACMAISSTAQTCTLFSDVGGLSPDTSGAGAVAARKGDQPPSGGTGSGSSSSAGSPSGGNGQSASVTGAASTSGGGSAGSNTTLHAGRGIVANYTIAKDTTVLRSPPPAAHVIFRQYRKEVCAQCFLYDRGRTLQVRDHGTGKVFCSVSCQQLWLDQTGEHGCLAWRSLYTTTQASGKSKKNHDINSAGTDTRPGSADIARSWMEAKVEAQQHGDLASTHARRKHTKPGPAHSLNSDILGFLLSGMLFHHKHPDQWQEDVLTLAMHDQPYATHDELQAHCNSYVQLAKNLSTELLSSCTTEICQALVAASSHNAFGIRSGSEEGEEYMGYAVYPSSSYFNHSCSPNVAKQRVGNAWRFWVIDDVKKGEQLCISYLGGDEKDLSVEERRARLAEVWSFVCECARCQSDAKLF
ncbi:Histone-lysine N-methyltransferase set-6 [Elasticomyces elasticus]|nr:Histone-lysine N-methyltransferase set-6 [Elasticomyces elasticus]